MDVSEGGTMDDDQLDGCALEFDDPATNTSDDDIAALVLFADVEFDDPPAVEARRREWLEVLA